MTPLKILGIDLPLCEMLWIRIYMQPRVPVIWASKHVGISTLSVTSSAFRVLEIFPVQYFEIFQIISNVAEDEEIPNNYFWTDWSNSLFYRYTIEHALEIQLEKKRKESVQNYIIKTILLLHFLLYICKNFEQLNI